MAKNEYAYPSIARFVADSSFLMLQNLQRNPAVLLASVRAFVFGAQDLSDDVIMEQFRAALPPPIVVPLPGINAADSGEELSSLTDDHGVHLSDGGSSGSLGTFTVSHSVESMNPVQAALVAFGGAGGDSSVQDFEPLPVGRFDGAAAVPVVGESVTGSGSSDGKPPAKKKTTE
jgi:hypothetical protein